MSSTTTPHLALAPVYSPQQEAIFHFFLDATKRHAIVVARAGAGKTTTIVEAVKRLILAHPKAKVLVCAFNKSIQMEVAARLPPGVDCMTLHSLGYKALMRAWGYCKPQDKRALEIIRSVVPEDTSSDVCQDLRKLVGLAMNTMASSAEQIENLMYDFDCAPSVEVDPEIYVSWAQKALDASNVKAPEISFDQMIYVPAVNGWRTGAYDFVIVDETQDMNAAQLIVARNALKANGRFVAVGDPRQAIYGFRGATSDSMDHIKNELRAEELKLSVTYRCPKAVVALANEIVPDLEAAPSAPDGSVVEGVTEHQFLRDVRAGDFVLSRKNAPLAVYCLKMLALGRPAFIQGKDVGAGLQALVRKPRRKVLTDYLEWLKTYKDNETKRLVAAGREEKVDELADKVEALVVLSEGLSSTDQLVDRIGRLFEEGERKGRIMFSSVHKAKGMEAKRVWCLAPTFRQGKSEEEDNLCYVAWTRSQGELMLVNAPVKDKR